MNRRVCQSSLAKGGSTLQSHLHQETNVIQTDGVPIELKSRLVAWDEMIAENGEAAML